MTMFYLKATLNRILTQIIICITALSWFSKRYGFLFNYVEAAWTVKQQRICRARPQGRQQQQPRQ